MTPILAAALGSIGTIVAAARADRLVVPSVGDREIAGCRVSIVLVGVDPTSPISRTIDGMTGNLGFSHVYFDPCRAREGRHAVIDYTVARGVHWAPPQIYENRDRVRVALDERTGAELLGCVRTRIGRPLRVSALATGTDSAATCVGLIVACLPGDWQDALRSHVVGPCISPNTLASFFGVRR